jgi:heptosyltransferase III
VISFLVQRVTCMPPDPSHVLILRPGALGDTLLLVPALKDLSGWTKVTFVGREPGLSLLRPLAGRCLDFEEGGWHQLFEEPFGEGFLEFPDPPQQVAAFVRDADGCVERNLKSLFSASRVGLFPGAPPEGNSVHAAQYLAGCLARLGMGIDPETCLHRARQVPLLSAGKPAGEEVGIVLHPGSGGRYKNHPPAFWQNLIRAFQGAAEGFGTRRMTLLLGPAEEALREAFVGADLPGTVRIVDTPETEALSSLLGRAMLFVGHDSGVTHLSAMLGASTVALFRGTDPRVWGPLGPRVQVISGEPPERGLIEATLQAAKAVGGSGAGGSGAG